MTLEQIHDLIDRHTVINRQHGVLELDLEQRSDEWLEARRVCIGGTAASILAGSNPYANLGNLWDEMVMGERSPENMRMRVGVALEDFVLQLIHEDLLRGSEGWTLHPGIVAMSPTIVEFEGEKLHLIASLDGILNLQGRNYVAEAKTTSDSAWRAGGGKPYPYHVAQVQHYLAVTGWDAGYIGYLVGNSKFECFLITADPDWIDRLHKPALELLGWIHNGIRPEGAGPKVEAPRSGGTWIEAGPIEAESVRHYLACKEQIRVLEAELADSETFLKDLIGTKQAAGIVGDGFGLKATFTKGRASTDWKAVVVQANVPPEVIERNTKFGAPGIRLEAL